MFLSSYHPSSTLRNVKYGLWFAINCLTIIQTNEILKNIAAKTTNIISGIQGDCGGGGRRKCRCCCTTAAIIFILKNITTDHKNLSKNNLESPISFTVQTECAIIISQGEDPDFYNHKTQNTIKCVIIVCIKRVINYYHYYHHNNLFELKLKQPLTTISIQKITQNIFIMRCISPEATCMGTIHKYYEKIKDAVDEPQP